MSHSSSKRTINRRFGLSLIGLMLILLLPALACNLGEPEPVWVPENPKEYTAEVAPVEVYVLIDEAGNVVDFESPYSYGVTARMRYVLRFWDVGIRKEGYGQAAIYRVYTPVVITAIKAEIESGMTDAQKAEIYARTTFPSTEVKWAELQFSGGPEGSFMGKNPETGKDIYGHMDWREKESEMHVVFTEDIKQDYLVLGEEAFYNWP